MLRIGLTGGIGSGKTSVSNILKNLGVPIFSSDEMGRKILNEDPKAKEEVEDAFGTDMYNSDGSLDRKRMANLVFNDPTSLVELNAIVHPKVNDAFEKWCTDHEKSPYIIKEAAILLETGAYHDLDKIVNVFAPRELRIERVMRRDKVSRDDVLKRMRFQYSEEERNELADFIVMNEKDTDLLPQVMEMHEILLNEKKK